MKRKVLSKYKIVVAFIIGGIIFGSIGVYATVKLSSSEISYDNKLSGIKATTMKGAIDELYEKAKNNCPEGFICTVGGSKVSSSNSNIIAAYSYNSSTCVTGEESTCKETNCIAYKDKDSCPSGTVIKYKVNSSTTKYFYVLHDDGATMTLQQRENTINKTEWYTAADNASGPITILSALENATSSWSNVNNQTYTMGTTVFKTNAYTGCSHYNSCTTNTYTLSSRTAKARMITVQETSDLGCTSTDKSCPIWMYNYLKYSTNYGGTVNDTNAGDGYWTSSAFSSSLNNVWYVSYTGGVYGYYVYSTDYGARAVVEVNK